jgi:hypothetical protein
MNDVVSKYIEKQASPQKEICQRVREIIFNTFPDIKEEMKWGVPAYADGLFYIVALKDHVNLGFSNKGLTKEELQLFDGIGKTTSHILISETINIDQARIVNLLNLVKNKNS